MAADLLTAPPFPPAHLPPAPVPGFAHLPPPPVGSPTAAVDHRSSGLADPSARDRRRRRLGTAALVLVVAVGFVAGYGPAGGLVVGLVLVSPLERVFRRHPWTLRRPGLRTDVVHLLATSALQTVATGAGFVLWFVVLWPVHHGQPSGPLDHLPPLAAGAVGLLGFEVLGYWYHRASHEIPFLWRFHAVHHSSERLDWIAAARLHPAEGFFAALLIAPPLLLSGLRPAELGVLTVALQAWALLLHANVRWRLAFLDGWLGTPEQHHWHHSDDPAAWNRNYSGLLPLLDRVFGTLYVPVDRRPSSYGIGAEPMPEGWFGQLAQPFRRRRPSAAMLG